LDTTDVCVGLDAADGDREPAVLLVVVRALREGNADALKQLSDTVLSSDSDDDDDAYPADVAEEERQYRGVVDGWLGDLEALLTTGSPEELIPDALAPASASGVYELSDTQLACLVEELAWWIKLPSS
jgi:hypothetical protein